jgi:UDP-glucose 4-epimerase
MILVTGGLGFIGVHTTRALLDLGESCVLTQRHTTQIPDWIQNEVGRRAFIEPVDIIDQTALLGLGRRYSITGIVHLAGGAKPGALEPIDDLRANTQALLNVLQATKEWAVPRISIASTIGVYGGVHDLPFREDMPLPMIAGHGIPTNKKCAELMAGYIAAGLGFEAVHLRISAIWGPLGRSESRFFDLPQLVHAAVKGEAPDFSPPRRQAYAEDGGDLCYVKDCGRAIALLQLTRTLRHATYNVGSGRATTNKEVVAAIKRVLPDIEIEIPEGHNPSGPGGHFTLDITRLREDTGYVPEYDVERGIADYVGWLRAGNPR